MIPDDPWIFWLACVVFIFFPCICFEIKYDDDDDDDDDDDIITQSQRRSKTEYDKHPLGYSFEYDTIRYSRFTFAQKLTRWPA